MSVWFPGRRIGVDSDLIGGILLLTPSFWTMVDSVLLFWGMLLPTVGLLPWACSLTCHGQREVNMSTNHDCVQVIDKESLGAEAYL